MGCRASPAVRFYGLLHACGVCCNATRPAGVISARGDGLLAPINDRLATGEGLSFFPRSPHLRHARLCYALAHQRLQAGQQPARRRGRHHRQRLGGGQPDGCGGGREATRLGNRPACCLLPRCTTQGEGPPAAEAKARGRTRRRALSAAGLRTTGRPGGSCSWPGAEPAPRQKKQKRESVLPNGLGRGPRGRVAGRAARLPRRCLSQGPRLHRVLQ
jgi:hypothetical protein